MKIRSLTKAEVAIRQNPNLNELWAIDDLIYSAQVEGLMEITFNPPMVVHRDVTGVFKSSPYNYAITESNLPNSMTSVTKIDWR